MYTKDFDSANIKEWMIENVAKKYIPLKNQSNYRVGIFGHVNEIVADAIEDSAVAVKTMYPELFPNRASLPESIYAYAALAKYENFNAQPAEAPFYLVIYEDDLMAKLTRVDGTASYTISQDTVFYVDDIPFMLDYPITITLFSDNSNERIFNAIYDMNTVNPLSTLESPYIQMLRMDLGDINPQKALLLEVDLKQLIKDTSTKSVLTNDVIENISLRFEYDGDLANFQVYYSKDGDVAYEFIEKYLEDSPVVSTNKYCYYKFITENVIEIIFPYGAGFRPGLGSEIMVEFYTTLGASGNKNKYNGLNMKVEYPNDEAGDTVDIILYALGDSVNGVDKISMETASLKISEEFSARGSINNERDLQNYFNNLQDQNYITFMKFRDDCLYRRFLAFMLMRDESNSIIGTNTLNLRFKESELVSGGDMYTLGSRRAFEYIPSDEDVTISSHVKLDKKDVVRIKDISSMTDDQVIGFENNEFLYGNPLLITINKSPLTASFYINHINRDYRMNYSYINKRSPLQMMINNFGVKRDTFTNYNKYKLSLELKPTVLGQEFGICEVDEATGAVTDLDRIRVYIVYKDTNNTPIGYSKLDLIDYDDTTQNYTYFKELETNDEINSTNMLNIIEGVFKTNSTEVTNVFLPVNDMNVSIYVVDRETPISDISIDNIVPGIDNYQVTNGYGNKNDIPVDLMINLNDIMRSAVVVDRVDGENIFYVKSVPLFRYSYINRMNRLEYVLNVVELKRLFLKQAVSKLTNSFYIDFKAYNTYGKSKYYKIGYQGKALNKINITLNFRIKLSTGASDNLSSQIKTFISATIETLNTGYGLNFYISTLISELSRNFPEIVWIEFININNYPTTDQIIEAIPQNDITELTFVPEYISVGNDMNSIGEYIPNINISIV
ncbi:MAG: hypothetical protein ACRCXX_11410 [Cetobacterium sp.]|uniref:hypothetical protein n=1 Tax=Cetobacterium sp. TaxID=2071632 RepID=UPI003F38009A